MTPDTSKLTCFKCGEPGHIQAACTGEAFCMKCKVKGHMTAMCTAEKKKLRPIWVGYGVEGRGFFHVSIPEDLMKKPMANTAKIFVEKGNFSAEELMEELRELVDDNWDWQVRKLSTTDFMVVFPSRELLRMASRGGGAHASDHCIPCCRLGGVGGPSGC